MPKVRRSIFADLYVLTDTSPLVVAGAANPGMLHLISSTGQGDQLITPNQLIDHWSPSDAEARAIFADIQEARQEADAG